MEERVYRLRCVEGWSMVIPWVGFSLAELIKQVEPTGNAKFVEFVTLADKAQMPGVRSRVLDWPYVEGLRMDEAMHPLTLLAFGLYGEVLPNQNGAPVRAGGAVEVRLQVGEVDREDPLRREAADDRWEKRGAAASTASTRTSTRRSTIRAGARPPSAASARTACSRKKRPTLMFNGYEPQVGQLYAGMDLKKFF